MGLLGHRGNQLSKRTPRSFSAEVLSSLYWCMWGGMTACKSLHLLFLNFIKFLPAQLFCLPVSSWIVAQTSGTSSIPPRFVSQKTCWVWTLLLYPSFFNCSFNFTSGHAGNMLTVELLWFYELTPSRWGGEWEDNLVGS